MLRETTEEDLRYWDTNEALGLKPYYAIFGSQMVTYASPYAVMRCLGVIAAADQALCLADKMELVRDKVKGARQGRKDI